MEITIRCLCGAELTFFQALCDLWLQARLKAAQKQGWTAGGLGWICTACRAAK